MFSLSNTTPNDPLSPLETVRKAHFMLATLPGTIRIPASGDHPAEAAKPIESATLDDVAFALRGLEAEFNAIGDRMHALRQLYQIARDAGAVGADIAIDAAAAMKQEH